MRKILNIILGNRKLRQFIHLHSDFCLTTTEEKFNDFSDLEKFLKSSRGKKICRKDNNDFVIIEYNNLLGVIDEIYESHIF